MAVKASYYAGTQYSPTDMMQRDNDWISPGVLSSSDLIVSQNSPAGMSVLVSGAPQGQAGGSAWLPGGYRIYNDAQIVLTIQAADATNPRIDLVIAAIDTSTTPYTPTLLVIKGTAASSPTVPTIPGNLIALPLAKINVTANATSITSGNITDLRVISGLQGDGSHLSNLDNQPDFASYQNTVSNLLQAARVRSFLGV